MSKTFLHVGCGSATKNSTTKAFAETQWHEVRLDIDPAIQPDIVGTTTDMSVVTSESVDALFSSHNIEHLYAHEVPLALREFLRVLKPDGFAVITCPDLRSVAELIAADKLTDAAYMSAAGPITPLDILYGHRASVAGGNHTWRTSADLPRRSSEPPYWSSGSGMPPLWSGVHPTSTCGPLRRKARWPKRTSLNWPRNTSRHSLIRSAFSAL